LAPRRFNDVNALDKPGHDDLIRLSQRSVCDTDQLEAQRKQP